MKSASAPGRAGLALISLLLISPLLRAPPATAAGPLAQAATPADLGAAMAVYRRQLKDYTAAWTAFDTAATAYWTAITEKRRARTVKRRDHLEIGPDDYVLAQPPVYAGPAKPVDPSAPPQDARPQEPPRKYVPVVADVLQAAAEHYKFVPQRPRGELDYKSAYAQAAAAAGLTREQIVRVYGFEAGGNGKYDLQAGFEYARPGARAISTALGYNQLLHVNSVELMAEKGDHFIKALRAKAAQLSGDDNDTLAQKTALERKIAVVAHMVAVARTVPDTWSEHEKLADTPQGLGIHAIVLDIDVGPLLQTQKLIDSVAFARLKGRAQPLTAAELEMMNLTGDGNGLDMVLMPAALRAQVPTANFFQRASYARNPVAIRHNTVAALLAATDAKMDAEVKLQGAKDLAAAFSALRRHR